MVNIGKRIRTARQKVGMSQEELAQLIGVTKSTISKYEKGAREPRYDQLQRIADTLNVPIHELFDGSTMDADGTLHIWPAPQNASDELPAQELEALLEKLQNGEPLLLSPDDLAKLKATSKEQIAAALEKQEDQGKIKRVKAPLYKLRGASPERRERLEKLKDQAMRYEHSLGVSHLASDILEQLNAPQRRIAAALDKLNEEGQEKVATYAEDLVEMPKYQAQEPPTEPPQDTPAPQEGKDTTPAEVPPEGPQEPPEGRIQSITMICPICGQHLMGDTKTGKAFCHYCKRSFPLPQILK